MLMIKPWDSEELGSRLTRWMELRGLNPHSLSETLKGRATDTSLRKIRSGKTESPTLRVLAAVAESQNMEVGELVGILLNERRDPLEDEIKLDEKVNRDLIVASEDMSEAEVQNLQLMVRTLRDIKEELVLHRAILERLVDKMSSESSNDRDEAPKKKAVNKK